MGYLWTVSLLYFCGSPPSLVLMWVCKDLLEPLTRTLKIKKTESLAKTAYT